MATREPDPLGTDVETGLMQLEYILLRRAYCAIELQTLNLRVSSQCLQVQNGKIFVFRRFDRVIFEQRRSFSSVNISCLQFCIDCGLLIF